MLSLVLDAVQAARESVRYLHRHITQFIISKDGGNAAMFVREPTWCAASMQLRRVGVWAFFDHLHLARYRDMYTSEVV